eukprot:CAMPEP_0168279378 /NCGR_PEP_ID=MMETSP0141_2-20121125/20450_1 /TAXON_ID=44445 /ORGANISM="Pseudo-nitzschia australis, Strain 10249 10 AB" /LENGTH=141 /DNA_ID=CAMNT_0008222329 /DNA_START=482 /DNA_END=908 /DNA_ORIENTATION=-
MRSEVNGVATTKSLREAQTEKRISNLRKASKFFPSQVAARSAASLGDVVDEKKVEQKRQPALCETTPEKRVSPYTPNYEDAYHYKAAYDDNYYNNNNITFFDTERLEMRKQANLLGSWDYFCTGVHNASDNVDNKSIAYCV